MKKVCLSVVLILVLVSCNNYKESSEKHNNIRISVAVANVFLSAENTEDIYGIVYENSIYSIASTEIFNNETWYQISINDQLVWINSKNCIPTDKELLDLNPKLDEFDVELTKYRFLNSYISVDDLPEDYHYDFFYEGNKLSEIIHDSLGEFNIDIAVSDNLGRTKTIKYEYEVVRQEDIILLYSEPDLKHPTKKMINKDNVLDNMNGDCIVKSENEVFIPWFSIQYEGSDYYFTCPEPSNLLKDNTYKEIKLMYSTGTERTFSSDSYRLKVDWRLIENDYILVFDKPRERVLVSLNSGNEENLQSVSLSVDNNIIVDYVQKFSDDFVSTNAEAYLRVFKFENGVYNEAFSDESLGYGFDDVEWISNIKFSYTGYYETDHWLRITEDAVMKKKQIEFKNENPEVKIIESNSTYEKEPNASLDLYERMNIENVLMTGLDFNQHELVFQDFYGFKDNKLIAWFEVYRKDKLIGYTYRLFDSDDSHIVKLWNDISFILNNGEILSISPHDINNKVFDMNLELLDQKMILFEEILGSTLTRFYSIEDGSEIVIFEGDLHLSPEKTHVLINHYSEYYAGPNDWYYSIEVIETGKITTEIIFKSSSYLLSDFRWTDNDTIEFSIMSVELETFDSDCILKRVNSKWQFLNIDNQYIEGLEITINEN